MNRIIAQSTFKLGDETVHLPRVHRHRVDVHFMCKFLNKQLRRGECWVDSDGLQFSPHVVEIDLDGN